jgi:[acyl-carrier-protein] S-malonyltransferase
VLRYLTVADAESNCADAANKRGGLVLGFVFPGQGSQEVGMLSEFVQAEPVVQQCFAEADEALGFSLSKIINEGPAEELNQTAITQPAILTASVALWRLWTQRTEIRPEIMAGHSLGEFTALVCSDALPFADVVKLVNLRGQLMQKAVPAGEGAVAAILGLDDDQVAACCTGIEGVVAPANFNAPGQIVIVGHTPSVDAAIEKCQEAGAKRAMKLPVSVPVHCELMAPAAEAFAAALNDLDLQMPRVPIVQNVDAGISASVEELRQRLISQLSQPVLWSKSVQRMTAEGMTSAVECGPGKVLAGLIRRIDKSVSVATLDAESSFAKALEGVSA